VFDSPAGLEQNKNKSVDAFMTVAGRSGRLAALRRRLEALERTGRQDRTVLPFAVPAIDKVLPAKGLALGMLHEVAGTGPEEEDGAVAAAFLAGILARLKPELPVLWCLAEGDLYGPGLAALGLDTRRLILAQARHPREMLWAMEEGLRSPALAAVIGEPEELSLPASRRLLLAAEASGVTGFALRRWRDGDRAAAQRLAPNAAQTRWRITALPGDVAAGEPGIGRARWQVELWRCRGGAPASWVVEACDATGHVSLVAALADRVPAEQPAARAG
jgi:protein ImuA